MSLGFYGTTFVVGLVGYIGYVAAEPVRIHYRDKYAGRGGAFLSDAFKASPKALWLILAVTFLFSLADHIFNFLGM